MLGSFNSSHDHHHHQVEEDVDISSSDLQYHHHHFPKPSSSSLSSTSTGFTSQAVHTRQLLISCAQLISHSDYAAAHRLISLLSANSSPYGHTSTERLSYHFVKALSSRLSKCVNVASTASMVTASRACNNNVSSSADSEALRSCYLSLNQITPFIRFSHLTANQAILEATEGHQAIHILDFDIMHGVQWPPLMQAIAERADALHPPPVLRITGTGQDINILNKTGDRLQKFAQSLGLKFHFNPLLIHDHDDPTITSPNSLYLPSAISLLPDETLAVNCVLYLHRLLKDDCRDLRIFLHKIKALNPKVVTIAEREASHNHPLFLQRFVEAVDHYTAVFDSLEATLPPNSKERLAVEQIWFGREIMDIVAAEGESRKERHERLDWWEMMLRSTGFNNVPLSAFALSQAKLLLRLHYPSEGYQLQIRKDSFFLGWQNHALFSVSSWQ